MEFLGVQKIKIKKRILMSIYFKTTIKFFSIKILQNFAFYIQALFFIFLFLFYNNAEQAHGHFYYKTNLINKMQIFMLSY